MAAVTELDPPHLEPSSAPPRPDRTGLALTILVAALALGALGDALLRAWPWGLNVPLWTVCVAAAVPLLAGQRGIAIRGGGRWLLGPALFFAAAVAWRDSVTLVALNLLAALIALALAAFRLRTGRVLVAGLSEYVLGLIYAAAEATFGVLVLLGDVRWRAIRLGGRSGRLLAIARGLLIAVPLTLLFGGLFAAADAAFAGLAGRLFAWDLGALWGHLAFALFWAWIVAGYLRRCLIGTDQATPGPRRGDGWLGIIEAGVVLGMLNGLFLAFVLVQARYLFGGAGLVEATADLTYSAYARRGFFELVWVAALVLPLLLLADWAVRRRSPIQERLFRTLVGTLIVLLFIVMASAVQRIRLYQEEYGLTELRLYTTAFMGWLALVFGWFLATVLRGRRERFAFGALAAGFGVIALLNALNPDALIVRTNVGHQNDLVPFDGRYATTLSADAVPELVEALPTLPESERRSLSRRILARWSPPEHPDWRSWNWGRARAWQAASTLQAATPSSAETER